MSELTQDLSLAQARSLIDSYAFDLGRDDAEKILEYWLNLYHASWIRLATIEALYLGRYKAISIEHILSVWLRLGNPNPHFTYEFERLICRKLPKHLSNLTEPNSPYHSLEVPRDLGADSDTSLIIEQQTPTADSLIIDASTDIAVDHSLNSATQDLLSSSEAQPTNSDTLLSKQQAVVEDDTPDLSKAFGNRSTEPQTQISLASAIGWSAQSNWSEFTASSKTIHQFIPLPDVSSFFIKLKTFGESRQQES